MLIAVTLVFSGAPRTVHEQHLTMEEGTTVADAVRMSGVLTDLPASQVDGLEVGVWGKKVPLTHKLRALDRIELYRPLKVDPKVARRQRFVRQGVKSAGLFAKRRPGAKAGY